VNAIKPSGRADVAILAVQCRPALFNEVKAVGDLGSMPLTNSTVGALTIDSPATEKVRMMVSVEEATDGFSVELDLIEMVSRLARRSAVRHTQVT